VAGEDVALAVTPAVLDHNLYWSDAGAAGSSWTWRGTEYGGLSAYIAGSSQDAHSPFADPQFRKAFEFYVGLFFQERFRWLRENFEPVGHVAHGHLLFRVTPEALRMVTDPRSADWEDKGE